MPLDFTTTQYLSVPFTWIRCPSLINLAAFFHDRKTVTDMSSDLQLEAINVVTKKSQQLNQVRFQPTSNKSGF